MEIVSAIRHPHFRPRLAQFSICNPGQQLTMGCQASQLSATVLSIVGAQFVIKQHRRCGHQCVRYKYYNFARGYRLPPDYLTQPQSVVPYICQKYCFCCTLSCQQIFLLSSWILKITNRNVYHLLSVHRKSNICIYFLIKENHDRSILFVVWGVGGW